MKSYNSQIESINEILPNPAKIIGHARNHKEAKEQLELHPNVDIILLDNWLGEQNKSGIDFFLEYLTQKTYYVIFITAFDNTVYFKKIN
jgi:response regulator of citrate/malate metabolism